MGSFVVTLEQKLDSRLMRPRAVGGPGPALLDAARCWSEAVWARAEAAGPIAISRDELELALRIGRRPVFVCGVHRSGTTLMRDLLDGHPALAVLPSEGTFVTSFEPRLRRLPSDQWLPFMGQEWLRRLVNPNNQIPYWTLGHPSREPCPYTKFASAVMAWWPVAQAQLDRSVLSWPLVAIALAYAHTTHGFAKTGLQRWAEKTPTNERYVERLLTEFPEAKIIHVVRHPAAVYASRKVAEQKRALGFRSQWRVLSDLEQSYRIAARYPREAHSGRMIVVRYEDLVANVAKSMDRVAEFLDIEPLPILQHPTVAGQASPSNSSFTTDPQPGHVDATGASTRSGALTRADRNRIAAVIGASAAPFGYELASVGRLRASLLRFTARALTGARI